MAEQQTYKNHVRWYPLVHFVIMPLLVFNLIWQIAMLWQQPSWDRAQWVLMAIVFGLIVFTARVQAMKVQDRLIRLEEQLRYRGILSPELCDRAASLETGQMIALRFAHDDELADLIERTLNGEFARTRDIKTAVKNWRGDYLRV
jgi:Family of unknown function (DUF6526)